MRVVIGEDQSLLREGLVLLLRRAGFDVAGAAANADDLVRKTRAHKPDVVITDIRMPPSHTDEGLQASLAIREMNPAIAIVVLSQHVQRSYAHELLESGSDGGAIGYLLKQRIADAETFCSDLRRVCAGGAVIDPEVVSALLARKRRDERLDCLTARQREVLALMAEGRSNAAIAEQLFLTEKAVSKHAAQIYEELGLEPCIDDHRRVLAVMRYLGCSPKARATSDISPVSV